MSSRRQRSIPLGGRYRQVSLYILRAKQITHLPITYILMAHSVWGEIWHGGSLCEYVSGAQSLVYHSFASTDWDIPDNLILVQTKYVLIPDPTKRFCLFIITTVTGISILCLMIWNGILPRLPTIYYSLHNNTFQEVFNVPIGESHYWWNGSLIA